MDPAIVAAIIAAVVGLVTLAGTLIVQAYGIRRNSRDTDAIVHDQLEQQWQQQDRAFAEQREQLTRSFEEQREQLNLTLAEERLRTLNERFASAADRLGADKPAAVRVAAAHAMAGLADDWSENRQTCIDVLCSYLQMPYAPDPGKDAPVDERLLFRADQRVRHTVIRVITAHLRSDATPSWQGMNLDFTGVVFDGGSFRRARFSGGTINFGGAVFSSGTIDFRGAVFSGGTVDFGRAEFCAGTVFFGGTAFCGSAVDFIGAEFSGGTVDFGGAEFSKGRVFFRGAAFRRGAVDYAHAEFSGSLVDFGAAVFGRGAVDFAHAVFSDGEVSFRGAHFTGAAPNFASVILTGGQVDFSEADWSTPPTFDFAGFAPVGVLRPAGAAAELAPQSTSST